MKGRNNIINILKHDPSLAEPWINDEKESAKKYGHTYVKGTTIEQLLKISQMPDLFNNIDLNDLSPSFNCSCTA